MLLACAIWPAQFARAQFVDIKSEVEVTRWNPTSVKTWTTEIHCVVGTNSWQIDGDFILNGRETYQFTGTNIVEDTVITKALPEEFLARLHQPGMPVGTVPPIGQHTTRLIASTDGNPSYGHKVPQADRMTMVARIAWLAFCSGPCLKHAEREIFPPHDLWKEMLSTSSFTDQTTVFDDALGLPKLIDLWAENQQVMQYRVVSSTNVLGWEIPLEFQLAQYQLAPVPGNQSVTAGTNGWELDLVARGTVKAIGECAELGSADSNSDATKAPNK